MTYPFLKGHGTENDFVLLPDHDGSVHGDLDAARVRRLCDRRAGIGADGVLRVVRSEALGVEGPEWFMDYRNADGSVSEMCGNGVRVFARHLLDEGLATLPLEIGTRDGVKTVHSSGGAGGAGDAGDAGDAVDSDADADLLTVDMGSPITLGATTVGVGERSWPGVHVDMGNPHAVAFVDHLADAGSLLEPPAYDDATYPHGVNVEFVVGRGARHVAMRVHERGAGETRSCGTGACAVMVAAALAEGVADPPEDDVTYRVDVPGGELSVTWTADDRVLLTGPAVVVARGTTDL